MKKILLVICSMLNLVAWGQNISSGSIRWTSQQTENLKNNEQYAHACSFITNLNEVVWVQKNGERLTRFKIIGTEGAWNDVSKPGRLTFLVIDNTLSGSIAVEKTNSSTTLTIDFSQHGTNAIRQRFIISNVQPEN